MSVLLLHFKLENWFPALNAVIHGVGMQGEKGLSKQVLQKHEDG